MSVTQSYETPVKTTGRATLLAIALVLIGGFLVALWVSPDPRGYGTHQQLGLPPCTFRLLFGYPCPGCGMTTCFAHFVRGQFAEAARSNVAGFVMAAICAMIIPWSLISAFLGRLWLVSDPAMVAGGMMASLSFLAFMLWLVQLIAVVT